MDVNEELNFFVKIQKNIFFRGGAVRGRGVGSGWMRSKNRSFWENSQKKIIFFWFFFGGGGGWVGGGGGSGWM